MSYRKTITKRRVVSPDCLLIDLNVQFSVVQRENIVSTALDGLTELSRSEGTLNSQWRSNALAVV